MSPRLVALLVVVLGNEGACADRLQSVSKVVAPAPAGLFVEQPDGTFVQQTAVPPQRSVAAQPPRFHDAYGHGPGPSRTCAVATSCDLIAGIQCYDLSRRHMVVVDQEATNTQLWVGESVPIACATGFMPQNHSDKSAEFERYVTCTDSGVINVQGPPCVPDPSAAEAPPPPPPASGDGKAVEDTGEQPAENGAHFEQPQEVIAVGVCMVLGVL
eukprot:COSAG06_NODE_2910_length_6103_cov_2.350600_8_plen_213_part_01